MNELKSGGGQAISLPADVSKEAEVIDMVQKLVDVFGGLDVVRSSLISISANSMTELDPRWLLTRVSGYPE